MVDPAISRLEVPHRKFDSYSDTELISNNSRHDIWKACFEDRVRPFRV